MIAWNVSELVPGLERAVFGFDYRSADIWEQLELNEAEKFRPSDINAYHRSPTTISDQAWPSLVTPNQSILPNGTELYDLDQFITLSIPDHAYAVAFDVTVVAIPHLAAKGWFQPVSTSNLPKQFLWSFKGFDVVDTWLQLSALYSFTWYNDEIGPFVDSPKVRLAACGIYADEPSALYACRGFDEAIPEHAPFVPCGVWTGIPV